LTSACSVSLIMSTVKHWRRPPNSNGWLSRTQVLVYFIFYFEFELGQAVLSRGILMVVRDGTKCTKHLARTKFS
jgi:hypothetical protein